MIRTKELYFTFLWILSFFLAGCHLAKSFTRGGEIIVKDENFGEDIPIWYKNDLSIQKIMHLYIDIDANKIETRNLVVDRYTFIDHRTRSYYQYHSFSDTANFDSTYTVPDSVPIVG